MLKPQLDLFGNGAEVALAASDARDRRPAQADRPSLEQRYAAFAKDNPHVFAELLRLARARIDRGETYISIKALWEELRVSLQRRELAYDADLQDEHKLNNDYTALYARALIRAEPRLDGVIRLRARKHH